MEQFKILQCVEDPDLSFVVVPAAADNQLIDQKDVLEACQILEAEEETLLMLFIVSVHENADGRRLSVNARAPICIDPSRKSGTQYVFSNKNYDIRHMIS
jgi:flagellar assembly factor FliW